MQNSEEFVGPVTMTWTGNSDQLGAKRPQGLPDSADVGVRVSLQGRQQPECAILDPHSCSFSWDHLSRAVSTPGQVAVGVDRNSIPRPCLRASEDHWLPFQPELHFEMLATESAGSCSCRRIETNLNVWVPRPVEIIEVP